MMSDRECEEEDHRWDSIALDVQQGIIRGCVLDDAHGISRPDDEPWEDEEC
jgi:hypothetical protein